MEKMGMEMRWMWSGWRVGSWCALVCVVGGVLEMMLALDLVVVELLRPHVCVEQKAVQRPS